MSFYYYFPLGIVINNLLPSLRINHHWCMTLNKNSGQSCEYSRPVGWMEKAVFLTPMEDGVRLAGTAEFAFADTPSNPQRTKEMLKHGKVMLGNNLSIKSSWVGSRPSTPDSLPVIGALDQYPRVKVGFGHGHLGLTFAAITAKLITENIQETQSTVDLKPFSAARFK